MAVFFLRVLNMNELPNKKEIKQCYESFFDVFNEILSNIENKLKSVVKLNSKPTFKTRIKSFPSYYKKVLLYAILLFALGWFLKRVILREMLSFKYKKSLVIRSVFIAASFGMLLLAYADIHWGTYLVPVQKSGTAVSLVYDISNSMLAPDCEGGLTRLKALSIKLRTLRQLKIESIVIIIHISRE